MDAPDDQVRLSFQVTDVVTLLPALFISVVILYPANIWITLLDSPTRDLIIVAVFLLAASANKYFPVRGFERTFFLAAFGLAVAVFCQLAFDTGGATDRGMVAAVGYVMLTVLSLLVVFMWRPRQEIYATRVFIIVCSLMSLLGFVAWLIVTFAWNAQDLIDPAHLVDMSQFTDGKVGRIARESFETANEFGIFENTYSFPYYLGLVLTNSYMYELFGFQFFRASSWYSEPVSVWYLVIPAMVLTYNGPYFGRNARNILLTVQGCFLFASFSLSIAIALIAGYMLLTLLRTLGPDAKPRAKLKAGAFVLAILAVLSSFVIYGLQYLPGTDSGRNLLVDKILFGDYDEGVVGLLLNPVQAVPYFYFLFITLACCWKAAKTNDRDLMSFSLVVFCFLVTALKGALYHLMISPAFLIFFFLMLKHLDLARASRLQKLPLAAAQSA